MNSYAHLLQLICLSNVMCFYFFIICIVEHILINSISFVFYQLKQQICWHAYFFYYVLLT